MKNKERFKDLEVLVDTYLEKMERIARKNEFDSVAIGAVYDRFLEDVYSYTNKMIRKKWGEKQASKSANIDNLVFDVKDREKVIGYMLEYHTQRDKKLLSKPQLVMDTEGIHLYNHIIQEKVLDGAFGYYVVGGEHCSKCVAGVIEYDSAVKIPPYHPGCLCHITEVYQDEEEFREAQEHYNGDSNL